eukprot:GHUV01008221.1.p1 GENE.GHUV01008221.1~~GHUV01008221.1.p1  ORF type:complete len:623 (+),score=170.79 GHUV01008221.1:49-1917(+)
MPSKWNTNPAAFANKLGAYVDSKSAFQNVALYTLVAAVAAAASQYGQPVLFWLRVPHAAAVGVGCGLVATVGLFAAMNTFSKWRQSDARLKAQAGLRPRQRELLGLPSEPPVKPGVPTPEAAPAAARAATLLATPVTPSQRQPPLAPSGLADTTPRQLGAVAAAMTPGSGRSSLGPSPGSRWSPWSGGLAVATPEQLKQYVDAFTASDTAAATDGSVPSPMPVGQLYFDQGDQGVGGSPLPTGRDAPAYRPSLLARKAAAAAGAGGEGLQPSADAEAGRIMKDILQMEVPELLVWIERFREWLATQLLQPLSQLMETAHEEPNTLMARLVPGQQAPQLPSILSLLDLEDEESQHSTQAGGLAASAAGIISAVASGLGASSLVGFGGLGNLPRVQPGSSGGSAVEDARNVAQSLMDNLRRSQLPYGYDPQPLLMALHRYSELLMVLSGRRPSELMPPTPPTYIASRIRQLARSTCVQCFNWNGGGEHEGRPWTAELPTDSALLYYLFAAFLDAPGWQFPMQGAGPESSRGAPLYLGSVRSRPPGNYSALLAFRPDKPGPGAVAVIGSNLSSREPRFSLLLAGQLVTLCERDGLFKVLLMWLQYHLVDRQGLVGGRWVVTSVHL